MKIVKLEDQPAYDPAGVVALTVLDGPKTNVRMIRLSPGQALSPHVHGASDLMLYAVEGDATLDFDGGQSPFPAGSLASYAGDEELRVSNAGHTGVTLLAFLAPAFPPRG